MTKELAIKVTDTPTIWDMVAALHAAGWTEIRKTVWQSPGGGLYRGPCGAWKAMVAAR